MAGVAPNPDSLQNGNLQRSPSGRILAIAIASDDQRLYAGSYAGVWRSDDAGRNWQQMTRPQPGSFDADVPGAFHAPHIFDVAVSPADRDIVLAAARRGQFQPVRDGIYRSSDGGQSWTLVLPSTVASQVLFAPDDGNLAMAPLGFSVAISRDAGLTWVFRSPVRAWHLAIGPLEPNGVRRVYAAGDNQIWCSLDGGETWRRDDGAAVVVASRAATSAFIVANGGGAIPSFAMRTGDAVAAGNQALAIDPHNPRIVYLAATGGTYGPSYFARKNGVPIPDGTGCNTTADRLAGEGSLWFADFTGFETTGAARWEAVPGPGVYSGATTPSGNVFVVTKKTPTSHLLFFSDHSTIHMAVGRPTATNAWHRLDGRDASYDARVGQLYDHMILHVDPHGVVASSDCDLILAPATGVPSPYDLNSELAQHLGGTMWMANDGGIQWSDDGGETWTAARGLETLDPVNIAGVAGHGSAPALYIGTGDNDSFFTTDGGATWRYPANNFGDADCWFADIAQAGRVVQFAPRNNPKGMFLITGGGYPNAADFDNFRLVPAPPASNAVSSSVLRGYSPMVRTLATEPAPADGDYVIIGMRSDGERVLFRTLAASSITSADHWEDPARAQQVGPPLPAGVDIVQVSGGHADPVFYISDGSLLWRLDAATQQWRQLVPGGPPGRAATRARRVFADPFNPLLLYVLDIDGFRVSLDGGDSWIFDAALTRAATGDGNLDITSAGLIRDMLFVRTERFTRFLFCSAGVLYTVNGTDWLTLVNSIALPGCPESGFFDGISNPLDRTLYVACEGRSLLRLNNIPAPQVPQPSNISLLEVAAVLSDA